MALALGFLRASADNPRGRQRNTTCARRQGRQCHICPTRRMWLPLPHHFATAPPSSCAGRRITSSDSHGGPLPGRARVPMPSCSGGAAPRRSAAAGRFADRSRDLGTYGPAISRSAGDPDPSRAGKPADDMFAAARDLVAADALRCRWPCGKSPVLVMRTQTAPSRAAAGTALQRTRESRRGLTPQHPSGDHDALCCGRARARHAGAAIRRRRGQCLPGTSRPARSTVRGVQPWPAASRSNSIRIVPSEAQRAHRAQLRRRVPRPVTAPAAGCRLASSGETPGICLLSAIAGSSRPVPPNRVARRCAKSPTRHVAKWGEARWHTLVAEAAKAIGKSKAAGSR